MEPNDDKISETLSPKETAITPQVVPSKEEFVSTKDEARITPSDTLDEDETVSEEENNGATLPKNRPDLKLEISDPYRPGVDSDKDGETLPEDDKDAETLPEDDKETEKPLIEDKEEDKVSVTIDIDDEKSKDTTDQPKKSKFSVNVFPITRLKIAWEKSSNICEFVLQAVFIIFSTLGWLFCVGGIPFISIAMLVMGSVYKDDCKFEPNIPVYLIVAGVLGTIQHFTAVWTRYIPKDSVGRVRIYRAYCRIFDGVLQLFLIIWFVMGCIWVYGIYSTVNFEEVYKDEYCDKAVYLFAFWILNLSFAVLAILVVLSLLVILCIVVIDKN